MIREHALCLGVALLVSGILLASCTQTITTKRRSYSIQGTEADDSDKMREHYTSGFDVGEDGTMQSDKKDLYQDKSFRNTKGNDADLKDYRMGKKDMGMKEFRTPEYLNRQKDYRTKDSKIYKDARESDVDRFTTNDSAGEARIKDKPGFLDWLNPFSKKKDFQGADKTYRTSINRSGERAAEGAPSPVPMSQIGAGPQDQTHPSLSMDDVKKMLNPEAYE